MMKVALMTIATLIMTKLVNAEFNLPQGIQPNHPFKVTVKLKGYDANSTINNLTVGIYKDGGKQIGSFSSDGSQFSQPGYSKDQTVKTDSNGEATLTLTAKVSEDINDAHIRLKQGKKVVTTTDIH